MRLNRAFRHSFRLIGEEFILHAVRAEARHCHPSKIVHYWAAYFELGLTT